MRGLIALGHLACSTARTLWWGIRRRGAPLVFTHAADVDRDGFDRQMGAILDALAARGEPFTEITFVELGGWSRHRRRTGRRSISYAAIHAAARALTLRSPSPARQRANRARVATWLLRALGPGRLVLIDESGSGQPLVRAARRLGIPTVGVQHGDFQPTNRDYAAVPGCAFTIEPVDRFCVWSEWFRDRLLRVSPIYTRANTVVTGRARGSMPCVNPRPADGELRVLLIEEANVDFHRAAAPFVDALVDAGVIVQRQPHPADTTAQDRAGSLRDTGLRESLAWCDVAIGIASSALLEAIHAHRPIVLIGDTDAAGYAADGLGPLVANPRRIHDACQRARHDAPRTIAALRERVWGDESAERDAAASITSLLSSGATVSQRANPKNRCSG